MIKLLYIALIGSVLFCLLSSIACWKSDSDRVLLNDLKVITLYHGRMTNARRSSPIPQMKCVGGSAGCNTFVPQVVQCYNRGSDGYDVQWECQTDMDNAYRFGGVEVSCEGHDYPDDPHVLKGSCGLEYTLDLTKEGHAQQHHGNQHQYYGDSGHHGSSYTKAKTGSPWLSNLIGLAICGLIMYAIYVTCLSGSGTMGDRQPGSGHGGHRSGPPPPGFRDEYMPGGGCSSSYNSGSTNPGYGTNTGSTGGGFWSGAATGGLLGYMFGSRSNTGYHQRPGYGSGWGGSTWGGSGSSGWGGGSRTTTSFGSGSSGTRTASGFGGTKKKKVPTATLR